MEVTMTVSIFHNLILTFLQLLVSWNFEKLGKP